MFLAEVVSMTLDLVGVLLRGLTSRSHCPTLCGYIYTQPQPVLLTPPGTDGVCCGSALSLNLCSGQMFLCMPCYMVKYTLRGFTEVYSSHPRQGHTTDCSLQKTLVMESWWCSHSLPIPTLSLAFAQCVCKRIHTTCL